METTSGALLKGPAAEWMEKEGTTGKEGTTMMRTGPDKRRPRALGPKRAFREGVTVAGKSPKGSQVMHPLKPLICVMALLAMPGVTGCGLRSIRRSQDWGGVTDDRVYRTCHVGNYGSGVIWRSDENGAIVLTCAHLVKDGARVTVRYRSPQIDRWLSCAMQVAYRSHPQKEDLAVLISPHPLPHVHWPPLGISNRVPGSSEIVSIAFGAERRPLIHTFASSALEASVSTVIPDEDGNTKWIVPKALLYGGILQANSGSPVWDGENLVGLVESSPAVAVIDGQLQQGVMVSSPANIDAALRAVGEAGPARR